MDLQRVGLALRAVRIRRGWRQSDLATAAGVGRSTVSRIERGHADELTVESIARIARALDVRVDITVRWHGGDLDRLLSASHSRLHELMAQRLARLPGWLLEHEVTFSRYGERGSIDLLAYHSASRSLLVVELKTEIVDVQALLAQVDRYRRLAPGVARDRGWAATEASRWVVVADTSANRRRVDAHRTVLRRAFPDDRQAVSRWLRDPSGTVSGLTFLPYDHGGSTIARRMGVRRVRASGGGRNARVADV